MFFRIGSPGLKLGKYPESLIYLKPKTPQPEYPISGAKLWQS